MSPDLDVLQPVHLIGNDILALDIAFIFNENLGGFADFFLTVLRGFEHFFQTWDNAGKTCHRQLGTGDEFSHFAAEMEWGGAESF